VSTPLRGQRAAGRWRVASRRGGSQPKTLLPRGGCVPAEKRQQESSRAAVDRGAAVGGGRPGSAPLEEDAPVVGQPLDPRRQLQPQLQDLQQDHGIALQLAPPGAATVRQPLLRPSKRLLIESRWVSEPLAFAGELRPRRLNS
jgi:hypothetical protein